tara:strand:+ start:118 stop:315 length:198 start_codon:yes stop_codon:yes gene_type:complete
MNATNKKIKTKDIGSEIVSLRKVLLNLKFQKATGQLEKTAEIKKTRKKIAFLKTSLSQSQRDNDA